MVSLPSLVKSILGKFCFREEIIRRRKFPTNSITATTVVWFWNYKKLKCWKWSWKPQWSIFEITEEDEKKLKCWRWWRWSWPFAPPDHLLSWEAHRLRGLLKYFRGVIIIVITSSPTFKKSQSNIGISKLLKKFRSYPAPVFKVLQRISVVQGVWKKGSI